VSDPAAIALPPEFEPHIYTRDQPELQALPESELLKHFRRRGRAAGRIASSATLREGFIETVIAHETRPMLEIGPFCRPLVRGPNVRYLDVLDADGLRARAIEIGLDPNDCPETIHYLGDLAAIRERFAAVVSSHAIEHQPDLVQHLSAVGNLLEPGGRYFLIIPDKRYCFDALIPETTIAQVLQAHREQRRVHSLQSVIEHRALTVHNDAARHWAGDHGPIPPEEQARRIRAAIGEHDAAGGGYIDVHAWYWTPATLRAVMRQIFMLQLTQLRPVRVYDTPRDRFEFCAVLEKVTRRN
jgi:SAM-dependent methyltransferase